MTDFRRIGHRGRRCSFVSLIFAAAPGHDQGRVESPEVVKPPADRPHEVAVGDLQRVQQRVQPLGHVLLDVDDAGLGGAIGQEALSLGRLERETLVAVNGLGKRPPTSALRRRRGSFIGVMLGDVAAGVHRRAQLPGNADRRMSISLFVLLLLFGELTIVCLSGCVYNKKAPFGACSWLRSE